MNVLLVGGGGREHALAWALARSPKLTRLLCAPGNAGTAALGQNLPIQATDTAAIVAAALSHRVDLVVVGPEDPLALGLADDLEAQGIAVFGPSRAAAEVESSKRYAKQLMNETGIRTARGRAFSQAAPAHAFLDATSRDDTVAHPPVIKADGLAAGKGVIVPESMDAAHRAVDELLQGRFEEASKVVLIEERLTGLEASAMAFVDGERIAPMPLSCDYKRIFDGDTGPNTGGMGAYSPPGFLPRDATSQLFHRVHEPVVRALAAAGRSFRGVLYAGLMASEGEPAVLEFNARFGDPETQVLLPLLESDLLSHLLACARGDLSRESIRWRDEATVAVVLAIRGYPGPYETGKPISGLDRVDGSGDDSAGSNIALFHAGTALDEDGRLVTAGGRVLTVVARGATLREARERAYDNAGRIEFEGKTLRRDIALREVDNVDTDAARPATAAVDQARTGAARTESVAR